MPVGSDMTQTNDIGQFSGLKPGDDEQVVNEEESCKEDSSNNSDRGG